MTIHSFEAVALESPMASPCIRSHLVSASGMCKVDGLRDLQSVRWRGRRETTAGTRAQSPSPRPDPRQKDIYKSLCPLFRSGAGATTLRLLNCARRMVRSANCMDELKRANSALVSCRNSMGLEPLLLKARFLIRFRLAHRCRPTSRGTQKEPPSITGGLKTSP